MIPANMRFLNSQLTNVLFIPFLVIFLQGIIVSAQDGEGSNTGEIQSSLQGKKKSNLIKIVHIWYIQNIGHVGYIQTPILNTKSLSN